MSNTIVESPKYVFYTHSHITSLCIKSIIDEFSIPKEKVLIVCSLKHSEVLNVTWFPDIKIYIYSRSRWKRMWYRGIIGAFLKEWALKFFMSRLTNYEDYVLFTPHDCKTESKFLIFDKKCSGYYYIEEGLGSYLPKLFNKFEGPKYLTSSILRPTASKYNGKYTYNIYPKLLGSVSFNSAAFPTLKNKIILKGLPSVNNIQHSTDFNAPYLLLDDMVNMKMCSQETLIRTIVSYLKDSRIDNINIKFHYRQGSAERSAILESLAENQILCNVINDSRVMEVLFLSKKIDVIGFLSSLLYYHKIFGAGNTVSLLYELIVNSNKLNEDRYEYLLRLFRSKHVSIYRSSI